MKYIRLIKKQINTFSAIADVDELRDVGDPYSDMDAFGALDNKEEKNVAAGVIIFTYKYDNDNNTEVDIRWLYVDEDYRNQGVGTGLLKNALSAVPQNTLYSSTIVFLHNNKSPLLISFLEKKGYRVYRHTLYEMHSTVKRVCDVPALKDNEILGGTVSLDKLKITDMKNLIDRAPGEWKKDLRRIRIESIEPYISSVYVGKDRMVEGLLLIRIRQGGALEPVFYRADQNDKEIMRSLFTAAVMWTKRRYEGSTIVYANAVKPEHRTMISRLYPDIHPVKAWRGEYEGIK